MLNKNYQKLHIAAITIVSEMPLEQLWFTVLLFPWTALEIMENIFLKETTYSILI